MKDFFCCFYFFIRPSYPSSLALLLFRASWCGSVLAIFEPYAADRDWLSANISTQMISYVFSLSLSLSISLSRNCMCCSSIFYMRINNKFIFKLKLKLSTFFISIYENRWLCLYVSLHSPVKKCPWFLLLISIKVFWN